MKDRNQQIDRYLDGRLDADETIALFAWLAESPENAEVFARQSLLDRHLTELLDGGFVTPLETPLEESSQPKTIQINVRSWQRFQRLAWAGGLAAACLIIFSVVIALIRSKEVTDLNAELEVARQDVALARRDIAVARRDIAIGQRDIAAAPIDNSATINLYLEEHQDVVARYASLSPAQPEPMQIRANQEDILYYELLDDQPETMRPGIIVRGPSYQAQLNTSEIPAISNGHTLTLSEARDTIGFEVVSPSWLLPCYRLDQIRLIEGRDALQLLYTDGIHSISLFEQSLDGQRRLSHQDFREYAVYDNTEQEGVTILAWRDNALSYVLIGNTELSQLMNMAQSISAEK